MSAPIPFAKVTITVEPLDGSQGYRYEIPKAANIVVTPQEVYEPPEHFRRGDEGVSIRLVKYLQLRFDCRGLPDDDSKYIEMGIIDGQG